MKQITQNKFHKGFYELLKGDEEMVVSDSNGEIVGMWLGRGRTAAYLSQEKGFGGDNSQIGRTAPVISKFPGFAVGDSEMKVLSLEELKAKFPQVDAVVPGESISDNIEVEEKCNLCSKRASYNGKELDEWGDEVKTFLCNSHYISWPRKKMYNLIKN